jgi:1,2-diacylglycerol 3-beta-glucosyltransferase
LKVFNLNVDIIILFFMFLLIYYSILFIISLNNKHSKKNIIPKYLMNNWGFVVLIPSHNEESVIYETIENAKKLPWNTQIVVIDDGSTDKTNQIARKLISSNVHLLTRTYPNAKLGKGSALNYAYSWVKQQKSKWFRMIPDTNIIITVVDADGELDTNLLQDVATMLDKNKKIGGVQVPVTIKNSTNSIRLLMQDIEFVGFSYFVQKARHIFSSVGLGGNGQFVRVSALISLGDNPWSDALSEDLDLGLRLLCKGHELAYCSTGFVRQQGLKNISSLLKQRTRWIQGHYQSWGHLFNLWKSKQNLSTKLDSSCYLLFVVTVWVVIANMIITILSNIGLINTYSNILSYLHFLSPEISKIVHLLLSFGISILFILSFYKHGETKLKKIQFPGIVLLFYFYSYVWIYASIVALYRTIIGKVDWVKTSREIITKKA